MDDKTIKATVMVGYIKAVCVDSPQRGCFSVSGHVRREAVRNNASVRCIKSPSALTASPVGH